MSAIGRKGGERTRGAEEPAPGRSIRRNDDHQERQERRSASARS
jgi:hypothetical protein